MQRQIVPFNVRKLSCWPGSTMLVCLLVMSMAHAQAPQAVTIKQVAFWKDMGLSDAAIQARLAALEPPPQFSEADLAWLRDTGAEPSLIQDVKPFTPGGDAATVSQPSPPSNGPTNIPESNGGIIPGTGSNGTSSTIPTSPLTFSVKAGAWQPTGVQLRQGQTFTVQASGNLQGYNHTWGPDGYALLGFMAYNLKGKVGTQIIELGSNRSSLAKEAGELLLGITKTNDINPDDANNISGAFTVTVNNGDGNATGNGVVTSSPVSFPATPALPPTVTRPAPASPPVTANPLPTGAVSKGRLAGQWRDGNGAVLTLRQAGSIVTGTYTGGPGHDSLKGRINGAVIGNQFTGLFESHEGNSANTGLYTWKLLDENTIQGEWSSVDHKQGDRFTWQRVNGVVLGGVPPSAVPPTEVVPNPGRDANTTEFTFVDQATDVVNHNGATPDGNNDGHFRLRLGLNGTQELQKMNLRQTDANGNPTVERWSSYSGDYWLLAVAQNGKVLNTQFLPTLGPFTGPVTLDLYASPASGFNPGNSYQVEVVLGNGQVIKKVARVPG